MDRDGDLAGTTPADNLGDHAEFVAQLRADCQDYDKCSDPLLTHRAMHTSADVIEKLTARVAELEADVKRLKRGR